MENRINIAELLKDCPKGMELDCAIYENVELDYIDQDPKSVYPIHCLIIISGGYNPLVLTHSGCNDRHPYAKCVIFPKGKNTWEGFVPPCEFKDGDILSNGRCICIYDGNENDKYYGCYAGVGHLCNPDYFINRPQNSYFTKENSRLATREEKEKLFKTIKKKGYQWNAETKTLEKLIIPKFKTGDRIKDKNNREWFVGQVFEKHFDISSVPNAEGYFVSIEDQDNYELVPDKFNITELKPFDKVLVKFGDVTCWKAEHYSHYDNVGMPYSPFCCIGAWYDRCIPYEGNEHLLGTDDDCDEYYKNWK